ncbi:membrane lipoprotein lipid attachment site-containing protein [Enterococcus sp.]|uniref:membrane lipoprotein lipid attachment site-containing protein n=1 Tax=Enterococcus sp. TaxID=35783 RepID=UPI0029092645|nr:membrane lipoprotein lipid attachment site-containing protein [Enterococcus sp.]MDU5333458.1 membrane lipoprotein lipid attachment site-containing protein [Enterococcus sp.]
MKKYLLLFSALFVLAACNSGNNDSKDSTTKSTAAATEKTSSKVSTSSSESNSISSSNTSSTKTQTSSSKTDSSHGNHAMSAMDELQANYPNDTFPDPATISGGKEIGIAASEEQGILKVSYYEVNEETPFNDPALKKQTPVAEFQRQAFDSKETAQNEVGQTFDPNGQQVDLGHNITGYRSAGAGSSFLMWKEGNWSLAVRANNLEEEDPVPLAKQTVEYLEGAFLPVPHDAGQISLRVAKGDLQSNSVVWQNNQTVYKIMNADSMSALKMAVSMAK